MNTEIEKCLRKIFLSKKMESIVEEKGAFELSIKREKNGEEKIKMILKGNEANLISGVASILSELLKKVTQKELLIDIVKMIINDEEGKNG